jgi:hypothetical protein
MSELTLRKVKPINYEVFHFITTKQIQIRSFLLFHARKEFVLI